MQLPGLLDNVNRWKDAAVITALGNAFWKVSLSDHMSAVVVHKMERQTGWKSICMELLRAFACIPLGMLHEEKISPCYSDCSSQ